jgi:hypothetical protein
VAMLSVDVHCYGCAAWACRRRAAPHVIVAIAAAAVQEPRSALDRNMPTLPANWGVMFCLSEQCRAAHILLSATTASVTECCSSVTQAIAL